ENIGLENYISQLTTKLEKACISKTLEKNMYNRTSTANALKISRKTLFNKMKQYGISSTNTANPE
ncbi:helix-turn-helix domain-containing protein, partial [Candidatus Latescibacterota bacterium]